MKKKFFIILASGLIAAFPNLQKAEAAHAMPPAPMIERGVAVPPVDFLASILGLPTKLILWNWTYCNHSISPETEQILRDYIVENELYEVKFRLNQFAPIDETVRLFSNRKVGLPYRIIAFPFTFLYSATGRLLGGLLLSDYYDPFSNTVHIFSDNPAIVLHEAGHAKDFSYRNWPGTYAMARMLPGVNTFQEALATEEALDYLKITNQREEVVSAYKVLYPAYATYVGSYLPAYPVGYVGAVIGGHIFGRMEARKFERQFAAKVTRMDFRSELS